MNLHIGCVNNLLAITAETSHILLGEEIFQDFQKSVNPKISNYIGCFRVVGSVACGMAACYLRVVSPQGSTFQQEGRLAVMVFKAGISGSFEFLAVEAQHLSFNAGFSAITA